MTSRHRRFIAALAFGLVWFWHTSPAEAAPITITNVQVTIGPTTYTAATVGWEFPRTLLDGQDLVLTQSLNGTPTDSTSFNFDTSDILGPANIPQIAITANGITTTFSDTGQVLNVKGIDSVNNIDNEAQRYSLLSGPAGLGYQVFVGYADNTHVGVCGGWASSVGLNGSSICFPSPFFGATFFDGAPGIIPPILVPDQGLPNHCLSGAPTCFEGGVIRILATQQQVPEPATAALLLTGGALMATRRYARRRQMRG